MLDVIAVVLPVFVTVALGYGLTWRGVFTESQISALMRFAQFVALPCVLFLGIAQSSLSSFNPAVLLSFYLPGLVCFILGILGARAFGRAPEDSVAIGFACFFSNCLLLGVPINARAFGPEALETSFAIIAIHAPIVYGIGITTMEVVKARGAPSKTLPVKVFKAMFSNILIMAVIVGLIFNLSGLILPQMLSEGLTFTGSAAVPVALFALGGILVHYKPEGDWRLIAMICTITLIVHPALALGLAKINRVDPLPLQALVLSAAMAPGVNAYLFANMYRVAKRVNASAVLFATLASMLSLSVWILILR